LQTSFEQLIQDEASIREDYIAALYRINQPTAFRQGSRAFTGVVGGVASTGELIVQTPLEEYFGVGEIEWII
jgi:biotin-(acetyl-CoA carboxylase) ligase